MLSRLKRSLGAFFRTWMEDEHEVPIPDNTPYYQIGDFTVSRVAPWWLLSRTSSCEIIDVFALPRAATRKAYELAESEKIAKGVSHE